MRIFGRNTEKEKREQDFRRGMAQQTAGKTTVPSQQQVNSLGRAYYLQEDEHVVAAIERYCPHLIPAFSRLNATSKIVKPRDKEILHLRFEDLLLHEEMELGDEGDVATRNFINSLRINADFRILDAMDGYRGKLVTEEIERHEHVVQEPQKKRAL